MVNGGISNGNIYINAMTEERHTKKDSSYTLIYVPKQEDYTYKRLDPKFLFNLNDKKTLESYLENLTSSKDYMKKAKLVLTSYL